MIKRQASMVTNRWYDTVKDDPLQQMIVEMLTKVCQDDPAWGDECVAGEDVNSWVSSLTIGVVLENHAVMLEDCMLALTNK